jgi:hypothetical protein
MVERYHLTGDDLTPSRAANIAVEDIDGIVEIKDDRVRVKFNEHTVGITHLIKQQGFNVSVMSTSNENVELYKITE